MVQELNHMRLLLVGQKIGKDCVIFPGASIGAEPQDLKFVGEKSYVYIGDRTKVREYVYNS